MKVIVTGDVHGQCDLVNKYVEDELKKENDIKFVLSTGDFGMFYKDDPTKMHKNHPDKGNFWEYLEGHKKFIIPVITIGGNHDNWDLVQELLEVDDKGQPKRVVENFWVIRNGEHIMVQNYSDSMELKGSLKIAGLGGIWSPNKIQNDYNNGPLRKYFTHKQVEDLKLGEADIILMHDVIGGRVGKYRLDITDDMWDIFYKVKPKYIFVGHFHWWNTFRTPSMAFVMLSLAKNGYMVLDTDTWNAVGTRFDMIEVPGKTEDEDETVWQKEEKSEE